MIITGKANANCAALDAIMDEFDSATAPGFAIGVAIDGVPVYRRGVGRASVELPVPLSPTIRMRIGSTSKQFCVLALMLLQDDGHLSIDASVRTVLPELPSWADAITIRQLMAHTSGMHDSLDLMMLCGVLGNSVPADLQLRTLSAIDSVNFAPGESWNYNNGGYVLLSHIAERASGMTLASLLQSRIFEPLGMANTMLRPLDTDLVPNSATLHVPDGAGGWRRGVMGVPIAGEGGVVSTIDDMLLWMRQLQAPTIGSADSWAQMRTPHASNGYGLGLMIDQHRGLRALHHAGGVIGGGCQMIRVIDYDLDIVLITNGSFGMALYDIIDAVIEHCVPALPEKRPAARGESADGTFYAPETGRVLSFMEHGGQSFMVVGGMPLPIIGHADGTLSPRIAPTDMRVRLVGSIGAITALDVTEFGKAEHFERLPVQPGPPDYDIGGRYTVASADLQATIQRTGGGGFTLTLAGFGNALTYELRLLADNVWEAVGNGALPCWASLEFNETGFCLTSARTSRLRFLRQS